MLHSGKIARVLQIISLLICAFLYLDSLVLPLQTKEERVINTTHSYYDGMNGGVRLCRIMTRERTLPVPRDIYQHIKIGDTIAISETQLSRVVQKIGYYVKGVKTSGPTGFIASQGLSFLIIITAGLIALVVFQEKIQKPSAQTGASVYLFALSAALLTIYFIF